MLQAYLVGLLSYSCHVARHLETGAEVELGGAVKDQLNCGSDIYVIVVVSKAIGAEKFQVQVKVGLLVINVFLWKKQVAGRCAVGEHGKVFTAM